MSVQPTRHDRTLLLSQGEPESELSGLEPLESLRDATWQHQAYAAAHGYQSVMALAVDELVKMVREMSDRLDEVERQVREVRGWAAT